MFFDQILGSEAKAKTLICTCKQMRVFKKMDSNSIDELHVILFDKV